MLEDLQEGAQAVALGVDEVRALGSLEIRRDEALRRSDVVDLRIAGGRGGIAGLLHRFAEEGEEVAGSCGGGETVSCGGHAEAGHEGGGVADIPAGGRRGLSRRLAQELRPDVFDRLLDGIHTRRLRLRVPVADHLVDLPLMLFQERMDVGFVDVDGALLPGQDEVEVDAEADPGIERDPVEDEVELGLYEEEEGQGCPVHEPWDQERGVAGAESFVGGEDGEEDGGYGAVDRVSQRKEDAT